MRTLMFAAAIMAAGPALAQATPDVFNGAFIGVQGGWQQDRQTLALTTGGTTTSATDKGDGLLYGGQVGYDFRLGGPAVLGLEASITGRTGSRMLDDGLNSYSLTQGRTIGTSARLGVLVGNSGLFYGRAGYANAQYRLRDGATRISQDRDGYTLGAGYEQLVSRNVSARLEYNYADFGRDRLEGLAPGSELQYRRHGVTAGLNLRF